MHISSEFYTELNTIFKNLDFDFLFKKKKKVYSNLFADFTFSRKRDEDVKQMLISELLYSNFLDGNLCKTTVPRAPK